MRVPSHELLFFSVGNPSNRGARGTILGDIKESAIILHILSQESTLELKIKDYKLLGSFKENEEASFVIFSQ